MTARCVAVLILGLMVANRLPDQSEADWRWLDATREEAFDKLLPVTAHPDRLVAYRSYRDLYRDVPERYLRVERNTGSPSVEAAFVATLIAPVGRSIQQQLLDLHRSRPSATLDSVLPEVAVRRSTVASRRCAALMTSIDALSGTTMTIPKRDVIVLHPNIHRFVVNFGTASIDATLFDDDAPLVRWATEAIAAVERCSAAQQGAAPDAGRRDHWPARVSAGR